MTTRIGALVALAAAVLMTFGALAGCGPKAPCAVSPTQVDAARDACVKAEADLEKGRNDRSALEAEVSRLRTEIAELETRPAALADRLETLKKGSGR